MRRLTLAITTIVASIALTAGCTAYGAGSTDPTGVTCTQQTVPVNLSATDPTIYRIVGRLCLTSDTARAKTVQLLVSGLTYDHNYWDIGYQPDLYSYVHAATHHGYSTFNIDRLGVGLSDHPPADALTLQAHAHTVAQIVARLRTGNVGGAAFQTVVGVGHSFGAGILQYEAGTVTDTARVPDYLILGDFLNRADPDVVARIGAALYPADQDPRFASAGLPPGYLTTRPGTRSEVFFHYPAVDPPILIVDETLKQTSTLAERSTMGAARDASVIRAIQVPILITVGQNDSLDCNEALGLSCADATAVMTREASHYSAKACLSAYVVPDAGHVTNLHRKARAAYDYSNAWLDSHTIDDSSKDANGCLS